jgi:hypothetical protein
MRSLGVFAVIGFASACSSEPNPTWDPNPTSGTDSSGGTVAPGTGVSPGSTGVSPGTGQSGGSGSSTTNPPTSGVNPATSGTNDSGSDTGSGEENGYVPVQNPDGSTARPMWLKGEVEDTSFARLTNEQWQRSVRDLLHLSELPVQESQFFESIGTGATDFVNDQSRLQMSNTQWEQFQLAAEELAKRVSETDQAMQAVESTTDSEAFIKQFGLRAFRRPLSDSEVARYQSVFDVGAELSGSQSAFTKGASLVVETMLQSPYFLYRTETGAPGTALSGYEKAAKLSLYILRTGPSDELLAKAGRGELDSMDGLLNEARAMLETEEGAETFQAFHTELYELSRFSGISKSDPALTEEVSEELVAASSAFFDRIYREGFGLKEILTTRVGFVGPATAPFYGLTETPRNLTEVELPADRAGFFTQLPYLMYFARDTQSYGILRGVHINTEVLCAHLPELGMPAPPLPEVEYKTSREYMEKGTLCGGTCHSVYINTLGFSMENFDGLGRARELDNGVPVDTTGAYPFVGGEQAFEGAVDLMSMIAGNEMAHECYSRYIASYGLGRTLGADDYTMIQALADQSLNANASTKDLVLSLVSRPEFNTRQGAN